MAATGRTFRQDGFRPIDVTVGIRISCRSSIFVSVPRTRAARARRDGQWGACMRYDHGGGQGDRFNSRFDEDSPGGEGGCGQGWRGQCGWSVWRASRGPTSGGVRLSPVTDPCAAAAMHNDASTDGLRKRSDMAVFARS